MQEHAADLPTGVVQRLSEHYGARVRAWLDDVPELMTSVAERWEIALSGYHDQGCASVVATGRDRTGLLVVIKALPETARFRQERAALEHWAGERVCRLLDADNECQVLLLESVTDTAGGATRPQNHPECVAKVLGRLHERPAPTNGPVPMLIDYYSRVVVPRISRRAARWGEIIEPAHVARAVEISQDLCTDTRPRSMLHADLHAENVLFDERGEPVIIDPHAKIGSAAFDWAFWCVYYEPNAGFADRVHLCRQHAPGSADEALAWAVTLAVDGALYYLDTNDQTAAAMLAVLESPVLAPLLGRGKAAGRRM